MRILETGKEKEVHTLPKGPHVHHLDLPDTTPLIRTPLRLIVENGVVTEVTSIEDPDECRP
jgi:hypothetical protein